MERQPQQKGKDWIKRETRPFNARVAFLAIFNFFIAFLALAFAYLVRYLLNAATAKNTRLLLIFALVLTGLLLLRIALQTIKNYQTEKYRSQITCGLRLKTFSSILKSDYSALQKYHSGDLLTRLTADVDEIATDTVALFPSVVGLGVQCFGAIIALLTLDWLFTVIYVVSGVLLFLLSSLLKRYVKKARKEFLEADGEIRAYFQEGATNITTVKAYGAEEKSVEKAVGLSKTYHQKRMKRNKLNAINNVFFSVLSNAGMIFALIWCSISVLNGYGDYGAILSIVLLLMQLKHPFTAFSSLLPVYYASLASGERLSEIDELPKENVKAQETDKLYADLQALVFDSVSFHYDREKVLDSASTVLKKGKIVCITGASGTGKSTLFRLLLRVFSVNDGKIYADIGDKQIPVDESTRGLFAYVPQGNFLFSGSIYENLTFYADNNSDVSIKEALEISNATFVYDLPQGLQTPLLEKGGGLSEGQLQRLAIARALLSRRPILLLDEATSALDEETEKAVLENIKNLQNKTCLIVTHRPAALSIADSILRIEKEKIITIR